MNSIIYDDEIITPKDDRHTYYNNFLKKLEQRDCVKFALFCAKIVNPNTKETNLCIELVEKWLLDDKSVTSQELWNAAAAAVAVAYVSAYTAYTAAISNAADAWAIYSAAYTAYATAVYSTSASYAYSASYVYSAYSASYATYVVNAVKINIDIINKYLQIFTNII